ncbi:MAG TPA: segregation and condensation protein A [Gammaproteobacteria bacterium]|nr:segregation and condensation protein A [Gammaproteobacteria bacterium]
MDKDLKKELDVLVTLRKVISGMVREITPDPGMRHPLSDETLEDVRQSFMLIAAREKEISETMGKPSLHRPQYKGDTPKTTVVKLHGLKSVKKDDE